jgi:hypothetical protein
LTIGKALDITHFTFLMKINKGKITAPKKTESLRNALMYPIAVSGIVSSLEYLT